MVVAELLQLIYPYPGDWRSPVPVGQKRGTKRGGGFVYEQWSVFLLILIPHPQVSCLIILIPLSISQQYCILLGLPIQSDVDQSANLPTYLNLAHMTDAYTSCV